MSDCGFKYIDGRLACENIPVSEIAELYGTPSYLYSADVLLKRFSNFRDAFSEFDPLICFSVKSLSNLSVLRLLADKGSGFDIVSAGELYRVIKSGGDPKKAVFAGVGKTADEIQFALKHNVHTFNVESESELKLIEKVAAAMDKVADVALRVNPDVDANTHVKTTTGKKENKFGIGIEIAHQLAAYVDKKSESLKLRGFHLHLGSPIYDSGPYVKALTKISDFINTLEAEDIKIDTLNLGGGFCMSYTGEAVPAPEEYAADLRPLLSKLNLKLILEPGRHIAAPAGILLTKALYLKTTEAGKHFLIVDAAMNDLLRPALYDAFHRIWPVNSAKGMPEIILPDVRSYADFETEIYDVVGPVCESGDCMAKDRPLPQLAEGEILAIYDTGAYGQTMSSNYNGRPKAPEIIIKDGQIVLASKRESYDDMLKREEITI